MLDPGRGATLVVERDTGRWKDNHYVSRASSHLNSF
jgi:hypothetical protein